MDHDRRGFLLEITGGLLTGGLVATVSRSVRAEEGRPPLGEEIHQAIREIVGCWYPRCVDAVNGGFHQAFDRRWKRLPSPSRFIVFQGRMTWVPAFLDLEYSRQGRPLEVPGLETSFSELSRHGLDFLEHKMWDADEGGFLEWVTPGGEPVAERPAWKNLYGQSFGLYAAATCFRATGERAALELARKEFEWLETTLHDPELGGYRELVDRDGTILEEPGDMIPGASVIGRIGCKSMNAHIHILEAMTAYYRADPREPVRGRLLELVRVVRDHVVLPSGALAMFADRQWHPVEKLSSFGHELETAFLLDEAQRLLEGDAGQWDAGLRLSGEDRKKIQEAIERLIAHSLRYGLDREHGGFFNEGPPEEFPHETEKVWWVQVEALNGLMTAVKRGPGEKRPYRKAFENTWRFFADAMIDPEFGGCYPEVTASGEEIPGRMHKASPWKTAYHVVRALVHADGFLKGLRDHRDAGESLH
jgi:mannobiose 2-epimerase